MKTILNNLKITCFFIVIFNVTFGFCDQVSVTINDTSSYHVHAPGSFFSINVTVNFTASSVVSCQWHDFKGDTLGSPIVLTKGVAKDIQSADSNIGYYGLVFSATNNNVNFPQREPGESREYGFAILPEIPFSARSVDSSSKIGMVHVDLNDPYFDPGWAKTVWSPQSWDHATKTCNQTGWLNYMNRAKDKGQIELPLFAKEGWVTDGNTALSASREAEIEDMALQFFEADPSIIYWELGIEENLSSEWDKPYHWPNLKKKAAAMRRAADSVQPAIKLIYQVVNVTGTGSVAEFLTSEAAPEFDIIALHPYAWFKYPNNFPSPEGWMPDLIANTDTLITDNGLDMSIWYTEVGAPHHGNCSGCFFGYPSSGVDVQGTSLTYNVIYMIKIYAMGYSHGVEKIFWYNYKDRGDSREYAEDHFGMKDYWGYPKPAYTACINLIRHVRGKTPAGINQLSGDIWVAEFKGSTEDCLVAWVYPAAEKDVDAGTLVSSRVITGVTDAVGTPQPYNGTTVHLGAVPVFITTSSGTSSVTAALQKGGSPVLRIFPCPFAPGSAIQFFLTEAGFVDIGIYNLSGRKIKTLLKGKSAPGSHSVSWNGKDALGRKVAAGLYLVQMQAADRVLREKIVVIK